VFVSFFSFVLFVCASLLLVGTARVVQRENMCRSDNLLRGRRSTSKGRDRSRRRDSRDRSRKIPPFARSDQQLTRTASPPLFVFGSLLHRVARSKGAKEAPLSLPQSLSQSLSQPKVLLRAARK
jgi:hypothetical protein